MDFLLYILVAIAGSFWRRWFGGWGGDQIRALTHGATSGKTISRFAVLVFSVPAWLHWDPISAGCLSALLVLYVSFGQDFSKPWKIAYRYGLPLVLLDIYCGVFWALPLAFLPSLVVGWLKNKTVPLWGPVDGWEAYFELTLGAVMAVSFVAAGMTPGVFAWLPG